MTRNRFYIPDLFEDTVMCACGHLHKSICATEFEEDIRYDCPECDCQSYRNPLPKRYPGTSAIMGIKEWIEATLENDDVLIEENQFYWIVEKRQTGERRNIVK